MRPDKARCLCGSQIESVKLNENDIALKLNSIEMPKVRSQEARGARADAMEWPLPIRGSTKKKITWNLQSA